MEFLKIVGLGILAAVSYGIIHDQTTVRVCVEYFTIGHPPLIPSTSPTLLALAWGVVATWWVGLPLGFTLASAARLGHRPKLLAAQLTPLILRLLATAAIVARRRRISGVSCAARRHVALWCLGDTNSGARSAPIPRRRLGSQRQLPLRYCWRPRDCGDCVSAAWHHGQRSGLTCA